MFTGVKNGFIRGLRAAGGLPSDESTFLIIASALVELPLFLILGLVIGVTAVYYIRAFYRLKDGFETVVIHPQARQERHSFLLINLKRAMLEAAERRGGGYGIVVHLCAQF